MSHKKKKNSCIEVKKILEDKNTIPITYDTCPRPYDYVEKLFPSPSVRSVKIYLYNQDEVVPQNNFYGFYSTTSNAIFIVNRQNRNNISIDEIVTHELLHYISLNGNSERMSEKYEEFFVYANSLQYFLNKGWTDGDVVTKYLLPYFQKIASKDTATSKARRFFKQYAHKKLPVDKKTFLNIL